MPRKTVKIGFDFGTNTSVIAKRKEKEGGIQTTLVQTVVGYPKATLLPGVLAEGIERFFAEDVIRNRHYLEIRWPLDKGYVADLEAARDFVGHIRSLIDKEKEVDIYAVVGAPSGATPEHLKNLREAIGHNFARFIIVPEPLLAAIGIRDESRLKDPTYVDPVKHCLIVDIGAGTTDLCFLQGYYPTPEEQIRIEKAGNDIDLELRRLIQNRYPDARLHNISVTRIKEQGSYVGSPKRSTNVDIWIGGKPRSLELTDLIGQACSIIIDDIIQAIIELAKRCNQELVDKILGNIILTGGGSLIENLPETIEQTLHNQEFISAKVIRANEYKKLVALGALKTAEAAREDQWQIPRI
jgi:rod shape-determining protein MreB